MALQIATIQQDYSCKQDELYASSLLIVESFSLNQPFFESKKTLYTVLFGTNLKAEILAAKLLPDFQQRGSVQETARVLLEEAAEKGLVKWQELDSLITSSFQESLIKTKREEAGYTHYTAATHNDWESLSQLMLSGSTFITTYTAELNTGGMPPTFQADFDGIKTIYDNAYTEFKNAEQEAPEKRQEKIIANNTFYKKIMDICDDGKKYYHDNPAKRERFTFTKVLELVSSTGSETITVTIPAGSSVTTDRVFANSPIINLGTVPFHVCAGSNACDVLTSPIVNPNDQVSNTFGPLVTITNPNAVTEAKASLRVVR